MKRKYKAELKKIHNKLIKNKINKNGDFFLGRLKNGKRYLIFIKFNADKNCYNITSEVLNKKDFKIISEFWDVNIIVKR